MKTQLTTVVLIIMLAIGGTLATRALAYHGDGDRRSDDCGKGYGKQHLDRFEKMARVLDLTEVQQQQIKVILDASREANRPTREKLRANKSALRTAVKSEPLDQQQIRGLVASGAELKADLLIRRAETRQQVDAILTPEQRELREKIGPLFKHRHGKRHHHQRGHGPGPAEPADS